jgi:hypothetical protein
LVVAACSADTAGPSRTAMSESGVHLGRVADVEFDPQTGALTALHFVPEEATGREGTAASAIARAEIVTLTAKMAVVRQAVLEQSAREAHQARAAAPALGQVVGQDPAAIPVRDGDAHAAAPAG